MNYQTRNPSHLRYHRRSLLPMEADDARTEAATPFIIAALMIFAIVSLWVCASGKHF